MNNANPTTPRSATSASVRHRLDQCLLRGSSAIGGRLVALTALLGLTGCFTARSFIADKTQIELTDDISVCSQGVDDFKTCKPGRFGGSDWTFNNNFDVFAVTGHDYQQNVDQVRVRYLGTPYYRGSLHLECHQDLPPEAFPDLMLADDVDLASELQRTTVTEIAAKVVLKLRAKGVDFSASAEAEFRNRLKEDVASKVGVRFLWFLTKWTGGRDSIVKNGYFKQCVDEVESQNRANSGSASLVTGVAGLMVLSNRVDTSVSSDGTILAALSATVPTAYSAQLFELQGEIAAEWRNAVQKKFTVRGSRTSISRTVYPLWIQFE